MSIIPITTISAQQEIVENQLIDAISELIQQMRYVGDTAVVEFEKQFADFCNTSFAIATNSGTTALYAALKILNLKPSDEVITTPMSFCATADSIILAGGHPVFADIDAKTGALNPKEVIKRISKKTRAIVVVHLYGVPAKMNEFKKIAKKYKLLLIEDASHAHGSMYKDRPVGSWGDVGCFSLYPSKIIGAAGNAGIVVTSDAKIAAQVRSFCHHGREASATQLTGDRYLHQMVGINGGMDEISATTLLLKIPLLPQWIVKRQEIAQRYNDHLQEIGVVGMYIPNALTSLYTFAFKTKKRDQLAKYLQDAGIDARIYYPTALHLQPSYTFLKYKKGDFPVAESWALKTVSLPLYQSISEFEINQILSALTDFFHKK